MNKEQIIEEVSNYLFGFLKDGKIRINSFLPENDFSFNRLNDLLKLRFINNKRTISFMKELESNLSSIKSSTNSNTKESYYEVHGEIMWQDTFMKRYATNPKDYFRFVTREAERTFTTEENIVLKELLLKLYHYCYQDEFLSKFNFAKWYSDVMKYRPNVRQALKNVYIEKIENKKVPNRVIQKVKRHRKKIYQEAAYLLEFIRNIEEGNFSKEELYEVLYEFFILPTNEDVLFELYWIVQIIKQQSNVTFNLLDGTDTKVASWTKGEFDYHIYHNSTGSSRTNFSIRLNELEDSQNDYLHHKKEAFLQYTNLRKVIFKKETNDIFWSGRPDILLEIIHRPTNRLTKLVIGEVKNTKDIAYASQGLFELVEYLHLVKNQQNQYLNPTDVEIMGLLCLGNIEVNTTNIENVRVVTSFNNNMPEF